MQTLNSGESGQSYRREIEGLPYGVDLPLVRVPGAHKDLLIASFNLVGQVRLNRDLGRLLARRILREVGDVEGMALLGAAEKSLQLLQVVAEELGFPAAAVAYNRVKPHMEPASRPLVTATLASITSGDKQLVLYERDILLLSRAKRGIVIVDDVYSTGGTAKALLALVDKVAARLQPTPTGKRGLTVRGLFFAAREGESLATLPVPVHALGRLPAPQALDPLAND